VLGRVTLPRSIRHAAVVKKVILLCVPKPLK
jgi:hypothetical protein